MEQLLRSIISDNTLHAKWLNTLSLMENTGARKISASEHPLKVTEMILKHAAEEARHAYYLKKQISKISTDVCLDYSFENLLSPVNSYQYLHKLDMFTARFLKEEIRPAADQLAFASYLFVTYAIEIRADELYPVYQTILDETNHKVNVKSIILEEAGHLEEMVKQLNDFSKTWEITAAKILTKEKLLFEEWKMALEMEIKNSNTN